MYLSSDKLSKVAHFPGTGAEIRRD